MNIIDNVFGGTEFRRPKPGATFKYGNKYFMKTEPVIIDGKAYNAVCLTDGMFEFIESDAEINPFMAELKVL